MIKILQYSNGFCKERKNKRTQKKNNPYLHLCGMEEE